MRLDVYLYLGIMNYTYYTYDSSQIGEEKVEW